TIQAQLRRLLGRHLVQAAAEHFHAERVRVANRLQRLQKSGQVDDAFAGQQPLVVTNLLGGEIGRIIEMNVYDALPAGINDVLRGSGRMMPVPRIQQQTYGVDEFFSKLEHVVQPPDELVFELLSQMQRPKKFQP